MSWIDRDGNTWDRCSECRVRLPYPKTICGPCEDRLEDLWKLTEEEAYAYEDEVNPRPDS